MTKHGGRSLRFIFEKINNLRGFRIDKKRPKTLNKSFWGIPSQNVWSVYDVIIVGSGRKRKFFNIKSLRGLKIIKNGPKSLIRVFGLV
jgi:hypothetical protein